MAVTAIDVDDFEVNGVTIGPGGTMSTMTAGAGNGVEVSNVTGLLFFALHNDTGASVTYTFKTEQPGKFADRSLTIPDETVVVANGDSVLVRGSTALQKDSKYTVECSGAGKIKALSTFTAD